jgi:FKBP-type peptidyl-prolyl cis-trans isomerase
MIKQFQEARGAVVAAAKKKTSRVLVDRAARHGLRQFQAAWRARIGAAEGGIKCWTEALQLLKVGSKGRLVCPADLAYGDQGWPPLIKPGATLVFEIELLGISQRSPQTATQSEPASAWLVL